MQSAETVLGVIRERGRRGLPLEELYRQLFNPQLYLLAYGRLYSNDGAMTPGVTSEIVDDMSVDKIERIIDALRHERFRWAPARRVYIPEKNGKKRPLGMPTWSQKLVQEVVRMLLDAYYDVRFSDRSHGFRPGRGCHTALDEIVRVWKGTHWFIEGDISQCFDRLDHSVMLGTLSERVHDNRFLRMISNMLEAGYLEDWRWHATLSGVPQGGVCSPILSNIYLDRLDRFVETELLGRYNQGKRRGQYAPYERIDNAIARAWRRGDREAVRALRKQRRALPSQGPADPVYRRLRYIRYADDFLLGFSGPKSGAEVIKSRVAQFLHDDLKLELSPEKTLITHARTGAARFLGYEIVTQQAGTKLDRRKRRSVNAVIGLRVPKDVISKKCSRYMRGGKPAQRPQLQNDSDFTIVQQYQSEFRGFVQYYLLAQDVFRLAKLRWVMETSMLKTLAGKHRSNVRKVAQKYKTKIETPDGPRTCFQVTVPRGEKKPLVARFGGISLKRQPTAVLVDQLPTMATMQKNELIHRLLAEKCEMCGQTTRLHVHHVRKLADLNRPGRKEKPEWVKLMAKRRRKTLVVCQTCHESIHAGRSPVTTRKASLESGVR